MVIYNLRVSRLLATILVFITLLVLTGLLYAADNIYSPYPIIFVHGIDSDITTWNYAKGELERFFKDQVGYKYFYDSKEDYFPYCDYSWQNNGSIPNIAVSSLKGSIEVALKSFPSGVPESERKVIIVAHSMGGLVMRSLLKQDLTGYDASKIDRVVFLGTPHLGAPAASALWILNELNEATIDDLIYKYSKFYSASVFTGFKFKPINYSPSVFFEIASRLITLKLNIAALLKSAKAVGPDPDGIALEELRLAGDVNYHTSIVNFSSFQFIREDISLGHSGSETFLGQNNLTNPSKYKTIRGANSYGGKILAWNISQLIDNFSNNFTFPVLNGELQSLENAKDIGDGIVTKASQEGIGTADYTVNAFHVSIPFVAKGETEAERTPELILQAIDDAPVTESAYFIRGYPTSYIVIKVKDYLLADIEIADMRVDGQAVDLNEFKDPSTSTYKPYVKFKKDFLTERPVTLLGLNLKPGEFYVPITIPYDFNPHAIYFKFKNPAQKEAEAALYLPAIRYIIKEVYYRSDPGSGPGYGQDFWVNLREATYNFFRNDAPKEVKTYSPYNSLGVGRGAWIYGGSYYSHQYYNYFWMWGAYINMTYSCMLNFDLNLADKNIKQAKFTYNFYKEFEGTSQDFDVLILRDSSNTWPPTIYSSADTLLFELNTFTLPNMGQQKTINITLEHINPSGYNVWQIRPNLAFPEDNYIPTPIFYGDYGEASFSQTMRIPHYPSLSLFVTFEEKH